MWDNKLSKYLLNNGNINNQVCSYMFINKSQTDFVVIIVQVDIF